MKHEFEPGDPMEIDEMKPKTPRSILIAGDIDVCIKQNDCDEKFDFYLKAGLKVLADNKDPVEKLSRDLRTFINDYNGKRSSGLSTESCADMGVLENFVRGLDYIDPAVALQVKLKHETKKDYGVVRVCPQMSGAKLYLRKIEGTIQANSKWHDININSCKLEPEPVFDFCK
jgi:hypothetical protein